MATERNRRSLKNLLINKDIQLKIVLINLLHIMIVSVIAVCILLFPLIYDMFNAYDIVIQKSATKLFFTLIGRMAIALVVIFILVFIHQVLVTHRVVGPLVNFTNTFKLLAKGDFTRRIHLRKKDMLESEAKEINAMMQLLSDSITNLKAQNQTFLSELDEFIHKIQKVDLPPEEIQQYLVKTLKLSQDKIRIFNEHLMEYKVMKDEDDDKESWKPDKSPFG